MNYEGRYLVLRKTPYQENSLVVAGLSPQYGRLTFLWKGARSSGKKKFPAVGLFREFQIEFRESRSGEGMQTLVSSDMIRMHDGIAESTRCYLAACAYASYLLRNCRPMMKIPLSY